MESLILFLYPTFAVLINVYFFGQKMSMGQKIAYSIFISELLSLTMARLQSIQAILIFFTPGSFFIFTCAVTYSLYCGQQQNYSPGRRCKIQCLCYTGCRRRHFVHFILTCNFHSLTAAGSLWYYGLSFGCCSYSSAFVYVAEWFKKNELFYSHIISCPKRYLRNRLLERYWQLQELFLQHEKENNRQGRGNTNTSTIGIFEKPKEPPFQPIPPCYSKIHSNRLIELRNV